MNNPAPPDRGVTFDLAAVARELRAEEPYLREGQTARTLIRTPDLRIVVVALKTGIQVSEPGYAAPPHSHPYWELLLILEGEAEAWVSGAPDGTDVSGTTGDCVVINAWSADEPAVNDVLFAEAMRRAADFRMMYAKREYPDGRSRPLRLNVKEYTDAKARAGSS